MFPICNEFDAQLCMVLSSAILSSQTIAATTSYEAPRLTREKALELAARMLPGDPSALIAASRGVPGEMDRLAQCCSLVTIRQIAKTVGRGQNNNNNNNNNTNTAPALLTAAGIAASDGAAMELSYCGKFC